MPPHLKTLEHPSHAPILAACAGGVAALSIAAATYGGSPSETLSLGVLVFLLVAGGILISHLVLRRRLARYLRAHDFIICTQCRQPLIGLSDSGKCPECGTSFVRGQVVMAWTLALRPPRALRRETWRNQFAGPYTSAQRSFDIIAAMILPIICFFFDPVVFRGNDLTSPILADWWWAAHLGLATSLLFVAVWVVMSRSMNPGSISVGASAPDRIEHAPTPARHSPSARLRLEDLRFVVAGGLLAAALASFAIALVLLPFALVGLIMLIGALGLTPWFTTFALVRCGVRSLHGIRDPARSARRRFLVLAGGFIALGLPLLLQLRANIVLDDVVRALVLHRSQSEIDSAVDRAQFFTRINPASLDELVVHWTYGVETAHLDTIAATYKSLTGNDIARRADAINWGF